MNQLSLAFSIPYFNRSLDIQNVHLSQSISCTRQERCQSWKERKHIDRIGMRREI